MGVVGAAAMSATCLHGGVIAAMMTPLALEVAIAMAAPGRGSSMEESEDLRRHGMGSQMQAHSTKPNFVQRREVEKRRPDV